MSKYLSIVREPLVDPDRLASARAVHAARAFFVAIEAEVIELASDLLATGRAVRVLQYEGAVSLQLKERGPALSLVCKDASLTRRWNDAGSVVARVDELAQIPIPIDAKNYEREAEAQLVALMPTLNALLEK